MTPWLEDADVTLYHGDVLQVLRELPDESVDCVVTSPPYWGLRDYGTGTWEGGDEGCDHVELDAAAIARSTETSTLGAASGGNDMSDAGRERLVARQKLAQFRHVCGKCGATRIDQQLGLEPTPEEYVTRMVEVFREVRRVLAPHGTVWLNLGDSYHGGGYANHAVNGETWLEEHGGDRRRTRQQDRINANPTLKPKDLVGIPWRVAFALQADGWYLRSDIIWAKPNPMPESVTDRPTKAHEYVFLLSKQPRYFFDQEAVREAHHHDGRAVTTVQGQNGSIQHRDGERWPNGGRNIRSVWEIATQPYPEAHFATFPEELARRCIAAGTSERGKCPECGVPWVREVELRASSEGRDNWAGQQASKGGASRKGGFYDREVQTLGWRLPCGHALGLAARKLEIWQPCVVLDPFIGSGTVAHVARKLGRHAVGIDLNESYLKLATRRLQQQSLFAEGVA